MRRQCVFPQNDIRIHRNSTRNNFLCVLVKLPNSKDRKTNILSYWEEECHIPPCLNANNNNTDNWHLTDITEDSQWWRYTSSLAFYAQLGWLVLILSLTGCRVTWQMDLWKCLWRIILIVLIDMGRSVLIVGRTIPWGREWGRGQGIQSEHECMSVHAFIALEGLPLNCELKIQNKQWLERWLGC